MALLVAPTSTLAADLVVVGNLPPEARARIEAMDGTDTVVTGLAFRATGSDRTEDDDAAIAHLPETLAAVRPFELKLDGELVIMDDLEVAIADVQLLPNVDARGKLFEALVYQGFAVDRYFGGALDDDEATSWRAELDGTLVVRPWRDAAALEPEREVTPYEIAEAPQRVAYGTLRDAVRNALPGGVRIEGVPERAIVYLDGEPIDAARGTLRVPPGRHFIHVQQAEGGTTRVLARWTVDLAPASSETLAMDLPDEVWRAFVRGLDESSTVPEPIAERIDARGGVVRFARMVGGSPTVFEVTPDTVTRLEVGRAPRARTAREVGADGVSLAFSAGAGWLNSDDFYLQAFDEAPRTRATVNSFALVPGVSADYDLGLFRAGLGVDMAVTTGPNHIARFGEQSTRLRPYPHLAVGVRYAQLTAGYLFPHHPTGGLRATIPIANGFELRADGRAGLGSTRTRADGTDAEIQPVYTVFGGVGWRLR
jgi:hypothetical protein